MQTLEQIDNEIERILNSNVASEWLKWALRSALVRDPIGVANDVETMLVLLNYRLEALLVESKTPEPAIA